MKHVVKISKATIFDGLTICEVIQGLLDDPIGFVMDQICKEDKEL